MADWFSVLPTPVAGAGRFPARLQSVTDNLPMSAWWMCCPVCVRACLGVRCRSTFPPVWVVSVVDDEERKEGRKMTNIRKASLETQHLLAGKFSFNLPQSCACRAAWRYICLQMCVFMCQIRGGRTCLIIPRHRLGDGCSWISHWPCKNSQLKQERDSSHLWSDLFTYFCHQRDIEHMPSTAYNYSGTHFAAVAVGSMLIIFIIRDLACVLAAISTCRII